SKEYIVFGDNGRGKVRGIGVVHISDRFTLREVALVSNLGFNLLSVLQLLDEGFEVPFKEGCSRVLDFRGDLVCRILPRDRIFWLTSLELLLVLLVAWWLVLLLTCGSGIGDLNI